MLTNLQPHPFPPSPPWNTSSASSPPPLPPRAPSPSESRHLLLDPDAFLALLCRVLCCCCLILTGIGRRAAATDELSGEPVLDAVDDEEEDVEGRHR